MKKIDRELNAIKFKSFGKVKLRKPKKENELDGLMESKRRIIEESDKVSDESILKLDEKIAKEVNSVCGGCEKHVILCEGV